MRTGKREVIWLLNKVISVSCAQNRVVIALHRSICENWRWQNANQCYLTILLNVEQFTKPFQQRAPRIFSDPYVGQIISVNQIEDSNSFPFFDWEAWPTSLKAFVKIRRLHVCKWPRQFTAPTRAVRIWYLMHLASPAGLRILQVFLFRLTAQCGRDLFQVISIQICALLRRD